MSPAILLKTQLEALKQKLAICKGYPEANRPQIRETKNLIRAYDDALKLLAGESLELSHEKPKSNRLRPVDLDLGFTFTEMRKGAQKAGHGFNGNTPFLWIEEPDKGAPMKDAVFFLAASQSVMPPDDYKFYGAFQKGELQYFLYGKIAEAWRE